jgi:hypothetical protein
VKQEMMDRVLAKDMAHAKTRRHGRKEGLAYSVDKRALMNAVRSEGREILTEQGADYWKDQERKYPHLNVSGRGGDSGQSPDGSANRFGRVSRRFTAARGWERRVGGEWVPVSG